MPWMFAFRRLLLVARKVSNKYPVLPNHCHFYIDLLNIGYLMFIQCTCVFTYAPSAVKDSEQQWIKQLSFCFIASLLNLGSWFCKCTHYLFVWNQHKIYGFYFVFAHMSFISDHVSKNEINLLSYECRAETSLNIQCSMWQVPLFI